MKCFLWLAASYHILYLANPVVLLSIIFSNFTLKSLLSDPKVFLGKYAQICIYCTLTKVTGWL